MHISSIEESINLKFHQIYIKNTNIYQIDIIRLIMFYIFRVKLFRDTNVNYIFYKYTFVGLLEVWDVYLFKTKGICKATPSQQATVKLQQIQVIDFPVL